MSTTYIPNTPTTTVHHLNRPRIPGKHHQMLGRGLAKRLPDLKPRARARLAAYWLIGLLHLTPTVAMACRVFGVSTPLVNEELAFLKTTTAPTPVLDWMWSEASADERQRFVRDHLAQLWTMIDHATAA